MSLDRTYVYKVMLFVDIFLCAILFRDPCVTISAETGLAMQRAKPPWWAKRLNQFLNLFHKGHCAQAILDDITRAETAITYLSTKQT
jgi:hypothetical protein